MITQSETLSILDEKNPDLFNAIDRQFASFLLGLSGDADPLFELSVRLVSNWTGQGNVCLHIPSVAGNVIQSILIDNTNTATNKNLFISFDGGTTFKKLSVGATFSWTIKGNLTQIQIKGAVADCAYEIILNRE